MQKNIWKGLAAGLILSSFVGVGYLWNPQLEPVKPELHELPPAELPQASVSVEEAYPHSVKPNSTLYSTLKQLNVPSPTIHEIAMAAKPVTDLGKIRPGVRFQVYPSQDPTLGIEGIKFWFSPVEMLEVKKISDSWKVEKITEPIEIKTVNFSGRVVTSLWESAEKANMDPNLISELAEIFAWQVDFAREVRVDDKWRLSVEQKLVKGQVIGWGAILAAEYVNSGEVNSAVLFRHDNQDLGYFAPDGTNLKRMFLKSPIRYGRISSRFQKARFHPILQVNRAHLGVDYAAAIGTPIRAVGDGTILLASWRGGGGKTVKIRHNSIYETAYKHLSGFAKNIRTGSQVRQGDIIGYVGSTGLSTGPHLHFEFFQSGRYVDPLGKKFPSAEPVPKELMAQFQTVLSQNLALLPPWETAVEVSKTASEVGNSSL